MSVSSTERRLAAIMVADVVGYSRLMAADEAGTLAHLKAVRADVFDPVVARHRGRIVKLMGDGALVEFPSVVDAVTCAVAIQQGMAERNAGVSGDKSINFRIGVNLGDVIIEGEDIYGDGVNVAARLEALAEPGGICVSYAVHDQVDGKLPIAFAYLGEQQVKNIAKPVRAYRIDLARSGVKAKAMITSGSETTRRRQSIAVLPFANMSGDPEQEYFSDGITEDLITALARHHGLFVIARNSSFVFKGKAVSVSEVGKQLGVRYLVEGSVRKAGKRIRVTAQLIDTESNAHVWAEKYDRDLEDIFAVQDEIVETLVWRVAGNITKVELDRTKSLKTESMNAYELLLRGINTLERATYENTESAITIWRQAYELDPTWGRPLSHIALAYMVLGFQTLEAPNFDKAVDHAQRALALSDAEDWTDALIGSIAAKRHDFKAAEVHIERSLAKNPSDPMTLQWQGYSHYWRGDSRKAIDIGLELRRLDPFDRVWVNDLLGYAYYCAGEYEASLEAFNRCMPFEWWADNGYLTACLGQLGQTDEAQKAWRQLLTTRPDFTVEKFVAMMSVSRGEDKEHWRDGLLKAGLLP